MFDLQKASIFKRISAYLFDLILLGILAVGLMFLISVISGYDNYATELVNQRISCEQEYNVDFSITQADYDKLTEQDVARYNEAWGDYLTRTGKATTMVINLSFVIVSLGLLVAFLVLEFVLPLVFKNGQTLGKKIFSVCVMRVDGVRVTPSLMFVRTILGKYTIETMIPAAILLTIYYKITFGLDTLNPIIGLVIIALMLIAQLVLIITTSNNSLIHDALSSTVVVDMSSQMIFDNPDALMERKRQLAAEQADKQAYN